MNSGRITLLVGLILSCLIQACSPVYYQATTQNVPLFSHKGEALGAVHLSADQSELQGAYALSDKFYGNLNLQFAKHKDDTDGDGGKGTVMELGGGYYHPFTNHSAVAFGAFLGVGSFENHFPSTKTSTSNGTIAASLNKIGIESSWGMRWKYFETALSLRFTHLGYSNIQGDLVFDKKDQPEELRKSSSNLLIEPALTFRAGIEPIKLQLQIGRSNNLTDIGFRQRENIVSLGIICRLNRKTF